MDINVIPTYHIEMDVTHEEIMRVISAVDLAYQMNLNHGDEFTDKTLQSLIEFKNQLVLAMNKGVN